jgi:hypothetical protein
MKSWWKVDEKLMKKWRKVDEKLMKSWWKFSTRKSFLLILDMYAPVGNYFWKAVSKQRSNFRKKTLSKARKFFLKFRIQKSFFCVCWDPVTSEWLSSLMRSQRFDWNWFECQVGLLSSATTLSKKYQSAEIFAKCCFFTYFLATTLSKKISFGWNNLKMLLFQIFLGPMALFLHCIHIYLIWM